MKQNTKFEVFDGVEVPVSPLLKKQRSSRYGSIAGLDDEDLIEPAEVERIYLKSEFAPILALPVKTSRGWMRGYIDEDGTIELGAFGTVDFDRYVHFDKALYKADKLDEERKDLIIRAKILNERIKNSAKYKVLHQVSKGIIGTDYIENWDLRELAKLYLRIISLRDQIIELREKSRLKKVKRLQKWLDSLGD